MDYYQKALPLIAKWGSYEPYTLIGQLADMESLVLREISSKFVQTVASDLGKWWKEQGFDIEHPEALPFFARWKNGILSVSDEGGMQ